MNSAMKTLSALGSVGAVALANAPVDAQQTLEETLVVDFSKGQAQQKNQTTGRQCGRASTQRARPFVNRSSRRSVGHQSTQRPPRVYRQTHSLPSEG